MGTSYLCVLCENKLIKAGLYKKSGFEGVISIYKYDTLIKKLIEKIKYEMLSDAIEEMSLLMVKNLKLDYPNVIKYWQREKFVMIAIPLYWQRENWRGFNQSEVLGRSVADKLGLKFDNELLFRHRNRKNQASILGIKQKLKNVENIFELRNKEMTPQKIVLIDDVITSGATMTAARKTLEKNSQVQIWALSLAGVRR